MSSRPFLLLSLVALLVLVSALAFQPPVVASPGPYYPTEYNLLGSTAYVSGGLTDLHSDNGVYMFFRSYASETSAQTLYVHQETITIAGTSYYFLRLESADTVGISLSASTASTGRELWGNFVYPLSGVTSIPASTWTFYYRTWYSDVPEEVFTNSPSSVPAGGWGNPYDAYSSDNASAYTSTNWETQQYGNYGFNIPPSANITKVEVGYEAYTAGDEKIGITLSWNNGTAWAPPYISPELGTWDPDTVTWVNFTDATSWTAEKLSNANFRTQVIGVMFGAESNEVYLDWIPVRVTYVADPPSAHADVNILIRKSDGTIRQPIATDVANSANLTTTPQTISGTYSWPAYTVVNETDYLEIDYYLGVTAANSGVTAYLRIDDNTLAIADQTRTTGIMLPSEYTMEVEFTGSSNTDYWTQLIWTVDSAWTTGSVSVTLQLYNYTLGAYSTSGDGYIAYTSSSTSNTDETKSQTITTNPTNFRDASGNWKMKINGVKSTTPQFDFKADLIKYEVTVTPPDVAILNVTRSPTSVYPGDIVTINVTVKNEGGTTETFNVTLYYDDTQIGKQTVSNLAPDNNTTLTFNWNTTGVSPDPYTIKAVADTVPDETDIADNTYVDGYLEVKAIHDIAVISVTASPTTVTVGQTVNITVVVKNEGLVSETFNVTSYHNNRVIGTQTLIDLDAGANQTLLFIWNTTGVSMGNYIIKAVASNVTGETDTDDNTFIDGAINVSMVYVHDVAVVSVTPSATGVYVGQAVNISVAVINEGTANETFNVTLYYDSTAIGTQTVTDLEPGTETTLRFSWDTTDVTPDVSYTIKAEASTVAGETDTIDNTYTYDTMKVKSQVISEPFDWVPVLPYLIPILLGVLGLSVAGIAWKKREVGQGFEFFNEMTDGGIPDAYSVMIIGGAGSGKSVLCQQLAYNYVTRGKSCVYVTYDIFPSEVRQNMKNFQWDISLYEQEGTFKFVDSYSGMAGLDSEEKYYVEQPFSLSDLGITMSAAIDDVKHKSIRVFLDSTAPLFARVDPSKITEFLQDRSARVKGDNGAFFFTVGEGTVPSDLMRRLEEIVDCIIKLDVYEGKGKTWKRMRVRKLRGRRVADAWIPFKIELKKGITFLPPKGWSKSRKS